MFFPCHIGALSKRPAYRLFNSLQKCVLFDLLFTIDYSQVSVKSLLTCRGLFVKMQMLLSSRKDGLKGNSCISL